MNADVSALFDAFAFASSEWQFAVHDSRLIGLNRSICTTLILVNEMKSFRILLATILVPALVVISGCDSNVEDDSTMLSFDFDPTVGGTPLVAGSQTYSINGRATTIESARFYVSEITLLKSDGSEVVLPATTPLTTVARDASGADVPFTVDQEIVLVKSDLGTSEYAIGAADNGSYSGIRFKVGIDGLANKVDASQIAASHPLAVQTDKANHWSWNSGFIFLRVDGKVDSDGDGTPESQYDVHLGTGNFLKTVTLDTPFTLDGGDAALHVIVDYAMFLDGLDYSDATQLICHTMDNMPVAQKVGANIADAFTFHGVHTH